ncbi:MAG: D-alanyl-D-alanine carboxypeptidase/D-alanyl-D-alanine-endopeptidase [Myxococcota bacterium]|nr:D-alanyl-D-alanine carboxypeptidase/D-alanyl-D-alanine-endopeptidase [Myxococcota bacterium]
MIRTRAKRGAARSSTVRTALAAGILLALSADALGTPSRSPLEARLDSALDAEPLAKARVAALVVAAEGGEVLYARDPDGLRIPASNAKILTALAALDAFGPTHRFITRVFADRALDAAGAVGEVVVRGGGDPALNSEDWWRLAADLRFQGLRRVDGDLLVDASFFDSQLWHPDWGEVSARAFHAPIEGLSANYGAFFVRLEPGAAEGDPLRVEVDPPLAYFEVVNRGVTGKAGARPSLAVTLGKAGKRGESIVVSGRLAVGGEPRTFARSVRQPALYAGALLKFQLEGVGVEVKGDVRRASAAHPVELLLHRGRPLAEVVQLFLKYSNNAMAESLLKAMGSQASGGPGTWPGGLAEVRRRLDALGVEISSGRLIDGSGLATGNRLSPRMLVNALAVGRDSFRFGPEFVAALPIGGRDGTMEERVIAVRDGVRAKTGFLGGQRVMALSGFAERADGSVAIFSILVNGYRGPADQAMAAVDAWVGGLVEAD